MKTYRQGCSLDCWDMCSINVFVNDGKVVKIEGNKENFYTKGIICEKGRKHLDRLYHKDRLKKPLYKEDGEFKEIEFEEAAKIMALKLKEYKEKYNSSSVFHFTQSGTGGFLKAIDDVFLKFYGGVTTAKGSTCWGAGIKANKLDFGDIKSHQPYDVKNSKTVILWGRNPHSTSIHLMMEIQNAKKSGTRLITIDPVKTNSAKMSDKYIQIRPGKDGALALAVIKKILKDKKEDLRFLQNSTYGFEEFKSYLDTLTLEDLIEETGISNEEIEFLKEAYLDSPCSTFIGCGMQRYKNGVNAVRSINALAAISGNLGISGGGASYANRIYPDLIDSDPYNSEKFDMNSRNFMISDFVRAIKTIENPKIKMAIIARANPMAMLPNLNEAKKSFEEIEFKVVFDMFMTDTAKMADLVIPCTNQLESEDIIYSSMHNPYILYNEKAVEAEHELMDEYYFYREVAKYMDLKEYPFVSKKEYINKVLKPIGVNIEDLKSGEFTLYKGEIPWSDYSFKTESKKFEFYSNAAISEGLSPMAEFVSYDEDENYPYRLLTIHPKRTLFTQHLLDEDGISIVMVNQKVASINGFEEGEKILVESRYGSIISKLKISNDITDEVVLIEAGWHEKHGNPNFLTVDEGSEGKHQIAYYDTFVKLKKI